MSIDRRKFIKSMGLGLASMRLSASNLIKSPGESESLLVTNRNHPKPAPKGYDRLPLSWYKQRVQKLKNMLLNDKVDAILLENDVNKIYFSGCFRGSGKRTTWVLFPQEEKDTAYWFSPGIDRDLIKSWWCTENNYYFCFPHGEGGFPNKGKVVAGKQVDLFEWLLEHLKEKGFEGKKIATDMNLSPNQLLKLNKYLPKTKFMNISSLCEKMRIIKTKEEIALTQRAYRYFDKIHSFARDYILENGTNTNDFEIGEALKSYGINLLMKDLSFDGKPHSAVGVLVTSEYVRAGISTAYPHPNQLFYNKVKKGEPVYVNTDIKIGGCGGEGYRNYQINPVSKYQDKMWSVVADTVQIIVEETKPGVLCSDIAYKVHKYQVDNGMQDYIYHRPGHGTGFNFEGHQSPYFSLGDHTPIEEGMMFSVEPGLYDSKRGIGINPSDNLLVTKEGSVLMTSVPFSKEWSYLNI
ncbi:MAG: M24 family metallopeptidase [Candidatus Neomarinimicrobiota bacterium]